MKYPCDTCGESCGCAGCGKWKKWYRQRQRAINAYAKEACAVKERPLPENKFCYNHPDTVKRWLKNGPRAGCNAEAVCDTPCPAYLRWYDARIEIARRKLGNG